MVTFIKIKTFSSLKGTKGMKSKPQIGGGGGMFANHISDKAIVPRIHKEFLKLNYK